MTKPVPTARRRRVAVKHLVTTTGRFPVVKVVCRCGWGGFFATRRAAARATTDHFEATS